MTDLASRIRTIVRSERRELTYTPEARTSYERSCDPSLLMAMLGASTIDTAVGPCTVVDSRYEADRRHGTLAIKECSIEDDEALCRLDPGLPPRPASASDTNGFDADRRVIFLDIETTGLSGGAGTLAFLIGCGYFDLGAFQVRQFLLTSVAAERALLAAVADYADGADLIVTYNGKTFDLPLMETRWQFHRMDPPLAAKRHFDMLHPARRLWRTRNGFTGDAADEDGCSLGALESALFGVRRVGDVPGHEIPSRYFRFLRSGDPRPLAPVLEHNRLDLVSLAAVAARGAMLVREGAAACRDACESLALGTIFERAADAVSAESCYRQAAEVSNAEIRAEAFFRLARLYRRMRRFVEAAAAWESLLSTSRRRIATEALAVHHEHRAKNLALARAFALVALDTEANPARREDVRYRLARIDRKMRALERATVQEKDGPEAASFLTE